MGSLSRHEEMPHWAGREAGTWRSRTATVVDAAHLPARHWGAGVSPQNLRWHWLNRETDYVPLSTMNTENIRSKGWCTYFFFGIFGVGVFVLLFITVVFKILWVGKKRGNG